MKMRIALFVLLTALTLCQEVEYQEGAPELGPLDNDKLMACAEMINRRIQTDQVNIIII
jgi:hypothetical protein